MTSFRRTDVVVVAYNSRDELRGCVEPLTKRSDAHVIVVNNASLDDGVATVADLPLDVVELNRNGGFAHGCNAGWRAGTAEFVLFLNPDARLRPGALDGLIGVLAAEERVGAVAPLVLDSSGALDYSQRRFPRLRSTYAQAFFLHRLFPRAAWTDELVRDPAVYAAPGSPDWVSGACLLVRRTVLEELGGWDEGYFMYCEDIDLCRRLTSAGHDLRFEPSAVVEHIGGASAPRPALLAVLAESRLRYADKHRGRFGAVLERAGIALGALTHVVVSSGGRAVRAGHARALSRALFGAQAQS